jgi:hypothetical protein
MRVAPPVTLDTAQRETLQQWARLRSLPARQIERARVVLLAPKPLQILDGQCAEIDLATSKDGYVKAVASLQITKYERRLSDIPASTAEPHDLTLDALQLRVTEAQFFKNNLRIAEHAGGTIRSTLVAYLPGVGRVFFSLIPQNDADFKKAAVIEHNRVIFDIGSDHYEIAS